MRSRTTFRTLPTWSDQALSCLALFGICTLMIVALYFQTTSVGVLSSDYSQHCIGLMLIGVGLAQNVRFGAHGFHYSMVLVGAFVTKVIASWKPLNPSGHCDYADGGALSGSYFCVWSLTTAGATVLFVALILALQRERYPEPRHRTGSVGQAVINLFVIVVAANLVLAMFTRGRDLYTDHPEIAQWLHRHGSVWAGSK